MCGIAGIYHEHKQVRREEIKKMLKTMEHRGPDDEGVFISSSIGLGMKRLSIVDPKGSRQPLQIGGGELTLVFNGEIYNYQELGKDMKEKGHSLQSKGDGEVILHLYREEGVRLLSRLRGMFAFALWDNREKALFIARDRFGIKPLYYYYHQGSLLFASAIKAIIQIKKGAQAINAEALWHYLTLQYVPEPLTLFSQIQKLPPGHYLYLKEGELNRASYWKVTFPKEHKKKPPSYYISGSRDHLQEAVKLHLTSQSTGSFLSGGIDSAILTALLARLKSDLKAFTVSFPHHEYNESLPASKIAKELGILHYQVMVTPKEFIKRLPHLVWHMDEPIADPSAISLYFVASLARDHVRVIYSGEGADEIFGGYPIYGETRSLAPFRLLPSSILKGLGKLADRLPAIKGAQYLYRATTPLEERYLGNAFIFSEEQKRRLLKKKSDRESTASFFSSKYKEVEGADPLTRMQHIDLTTWMPGDILMKADKMTMACSLELRVPFLDHHLFEFAATIPSKYRLRRGESKHILRQVARELLPEEICRRKKLGFPTPIRVWLKKEMRPLAKELITSSIARRFFSIDDLVFLLEEHLRERRDYSRELWTIMLFILWYDRFFS